MPTGLLAATPNARQPERKTCEVWDSRFPQSKTTVDTKLCMNGQLEKYKMVQVCTGHTTQHPTWKCSFRCMLDQLINMKRWQKKKKTWKCPSPLTDLPFPIRGHKTRHLNLFQCGCPWALLPHRLIKKLASDGRMFLYHLIVFLWKCQFFHTLQILWSAMFCIQL